MMISTVINEIGEDCIPCEKASDGRHLGIGNMVLSRWDNLNCAYAVDVKQIRSGVR